MRVNMTNGFIADLKEHSRMDLPYYCWYTPQHGDS